LNLAIDLVIFDCDGVLVDSEVISCTPSNRTRDRPAGAALTFDEMRQLPDLIAQIGPKPGLVAGFPAP
jgi:beta-phosphoglucomutase-like phosphatase (HAD superfamily)